MAGWRNTLGSLVEQTIANGAPPRSTPGDRRRLNDSDIDSFFTAADRRPAPRTKRTVMEEIKSKNGYRVWRLRRDYKWFQNQLRKQGMNPDNAGDFL